MSYNEVISSRTHNWFINMKKDVQMMSKEWSTEYIKHKSIKQTVSGFVRLVTMIMDQTDMTYCFLVCCLTTSYSSNVTIISFTLPPLQTLSATQTQWLSGRFFNLYLYLTILTQVMLELHWGERRINTKRWWSLMTTMIGNQHKQTSWSLSAGQDSHTQEHTAWNTPWPSWLKSFL